MPQDACELVEAGAGELPRGPLPELHLPGGAGRRCSLFFFVWQLTSSLSFALSFTHSLLPVIRPSVTHTHTHTHSLSLCVSLCLCVSVSLLFFVPVPVPVPLCLSVSLSLSAFSLEPRPRGPHGGSMTHLPPAATAISPLTASLALCVAAAENLLHVLEADRASDEPGNDTPPGKHPSPID
eukprot:COSAG05_NODE_1867_length_3930_cov_3.096842_4_plen_181_part_00